MVVVPITAYVERYLHVEYGPGPYYLDDGHRHVLRPEFLSVEAQAVNFLTVHTLAKAHFSIENSPKLLKYYQHNQHRFDRGVFGLSMFFQALYHQVSTGKRLGQTYQEALAAFSDRYGISEDDYAADNAWRQYCRLRKPRSRGGDSFERSVYFPDHIPKVSFPVQASHLRLRFFSAGTMQNRILTTETVHSV